MAEFSPASESETRGETLPPATRPAACCGWARFGFGSLALVLAAIGIAAIAFFAGRASRSGNVEGGQLPPINAASSVTSEKFSMATGPVSQQTEGVFVLDHNSGLLQCSVVYPRNRQFGATFTANVGEALATGGKGGQYMIATGVADFPRASNIPLGQSLVYVLDTATGNYACYAIPFNRVMMNSNQPQAGALQLFAVGSANPLIDRDQLRR
jgi:hypothetical protein